MHKELDGNDMLELLKYLIRTQRPDEPHGTNYLGVRIVPGAIHTRDIAPAAKSRAQQQLAASVVAAQVGVEPNKQTANQQTAVTWVQHWDDEVESYYYCNRTTGDVSWFRPDGFGSN